MHKSKLIKTMIVSELFLNYYKSISHFKTGFLALWLLSHDCCKI